MQILIKVGEHDSKFNCLYGSGCEDRVDAAAERPLQEETREMYMTLLGKVAGPYREKFKARHGEEKTIALLGYTSWPRQAKSGTGRTGKHFRTSFLSKAGSNDWPSAIDPVISRTLRPLEDAWSTMYQTISCETRVHLAHIHFRPPHLKPSLTAR
ncbi:unnamed protein product [Ectocarpus sp. 12 AP-2014]